MAVFNWKTEVGSAGNGEFIMFSSKYGDGYSQDIPNGLNNETQKWSVVFSGKGPRVREVLEFLRAQKGEPFQWKIPNTTAPLSWVKCTRYSQNPQGGDYWVLTMEFEQGYAP